MRVRVLESPGLDALELPADPRQHGRGPRRRPLIPGRSAPVIAAPSHKDLHACPSTQLSLGWARRGNR